MTCPKCGAEMTEGAPCPSCGYDPTEEKLTRKRPPLDLKLIGIAVAALAALIAIVILAVNIFGGSGKNYVTSPSAFTVRFFDNTAFVVTDSGKTARQSVDTGAFARISASGKAGLIKDGNTLYYVSDGKITKVTEDCLEYYISRDGSTLVYAVAGDEGNDLYRYRGGNAAKIASGAAKSSVMLSPDGSAVSFRRNAEDGATKAFIYDGQEHELGRNRTVRGLANGAAYIYYTKEGDNGERPLYVQKKYKDDTAARLASSYTSLYFNQDLSEVLFFDGERTYYCAKGGEKQQTFRYRPSILLPANTETEGSVLGVKTFIGCFFYNDGKVVRLNKDMTTDTVARGLSGSGDARLSTDGKTIVFLKEGKLRRVDGSQNDPEARELAEDVKSFTGSRDLQNIYYVSDGEILAIKGTGKATRVAEEYDLMNVLDGRTLIYAEDELLFTSTGGKGKKVNSFESDVTSVSVYGKLALVTLKDGSVYYTTNGKDFTTLYAA